MDVADRAWQTAEEIARSERALDDLLRHGDRLHRSNLEHEATSCLVCFAHR